MRKVQELYSQRSRSDDRAQTDIRAIDSRTGHDPRCVLSNFCVLVAVKKHSHHFNVHTLLSPHFHPPHKNLTLATESLCPFHSGLLAQPVEPFTSSTEASIVAG